MYYPLKSVPLIVKGVSLIQKMKEKMTEKYQIVGFVGLRNNDGKYESTIPLYAKIDNFNEDGISDEQEEVMHRVSSIIMKHYGSRLMEFVKENQKSIQGEKNNG